MSDLKINRDQSSQWQKLAAMPEEVFERALAEPNPSTDAIIMRHDVAERPVRGLVMNDHKALWLWGTLKDFESERLLDKDPNALNAAMLEHIQTTTNEIAQRVAA